MVEGFGISIIYFMEYMVLSGGDLCCEFWDADWADWADLKFRGRWIYIGFLAKAQRRKGLVVLLDLIIYLMEYMVGIGGGLCCEVWDADWADF